eukprot:sb/3465974/
MSPLENSSRLNLLRKEVQSDPDLPGPDLPEPRFTGRKTFSRFKKLTAYHPDIPGTPIYRAKPFPPSIPVNRGPTVLDWTAVEQNVKIPWDLEATPLQIKTDSTLDSKEKIYVRMFGKDNIAMGSLFVWFSSQIQYKIGHCRTDYTDLPVEPSMEVDKIWTITKTKAALIISCNGVEVLNYLFADSSESDCVTRWGGDVEEIMITGLDKASDFYRADWTAVERDTKIPWDLEETPLQIKTDSKLGSSDWIKVFMYKDVGYIGDVGVKFSSPMQYWIGYCTSWTWKDIPVQPPVEVDKIWTITKTKSALTITCNNVEVLNYVFADSSDTDSDCVAKWGGDVDKIMITSSDTASDFYRAGKGLNC